MFSPNTPLICRTAIATKRRCRSIIPLLLSLLSLFVGACQPSTAAVESDAIAVAAGATLVADATLESTSDVAEATVAGAEAVPTTTADEEATTFLPPIRLAIPALDFATTVEPMAWQVTEIDGQRQAVWQVPDATAGWHINSAGVGAPDNILISGHHRQGSAVFAPLARGEVNIGDEIYVTDEAGRTYRYQVSEIAAPIPVVGATEAEQNRLQADQAPSDEAQLTLITGWPDFSDTHYLVIIAKLIEKLE